MEKKPEINYLLEKLKAGQDNLSTQPAREQLVANLFADSPISFGDRVVNNLKKLMEFYLVEEGIEVEHVIGNLEGLINQAESRFDEEHIKGETTNEFDLRYGTRTSDFLEQYELEDEVDPYRWANCARYIPTPVSSMHEAFQALPALGVDFKDFTFVDVGSGMGRNLLIASEYPFKKILGIEISEQLHEIALDNARIYKTPTQKNKEITPLCLDILDFKPAPEDQQLIYYFWEPISEELFTRFFINQLESLKAQPRKIYLVFLGKPYQAIKASGAFQLRESFNTKDKISDTDSFLLSIFSN